MMVFNFWHIKRTNGLYYYGLDYLNALSHSGVSVKLLVRNGFYVNPALIPESVTVVYCGFWSFIRHIFTAACCGSYIYTPTPHPFPFIKRQLVVLHDLYPFSGGKGRLKQQLFLLSARISRCHLAYINHSDVYRFYIDAGFPTDKLLYAPNSYPLVSSSSRSLSPVVAHKQRKLRVGLVGTDSAKKNYAALFASALRVTKDSIQIPQFVIYGHQTDYIQSVQSEFSGIDQTLISSDDIDIVDFFSQIDVLVSVAEGEGFGRPIATALGLGVHCLLLDVPVFREFFAGGATFYPTIDELTKTLLSLSIGDVQTPLHFVPPSSAKCAFDDVVRYIIERNF
ncbi:hypothetical protein ACET71_09405 [Aeromonas veronii]